jgi:hypothetical protein
MNQVLHRRGANHGRSTVKQRGFLNEFSFNSAEIRLDLKGGFCKSFIPRARHLLGKPRRNRLFESMAGETLGSRMHV